MRHFCFFAGPSAGFGVPAGRPFVSEAPENEKLESETWGLNYKYQTHLTSRSYFQLNFNPRFVASAVLFHLLGLNLLLLCQACLLLFSSSKIVEL